MALRQRHDSSRDLLEELEDGWGAPPPPAPGMPFPGVAPLEATADERPGESTSAEARTEDAPAQHSTSSPDLAAVDEGWLDELFPGEEEDDDDDDEDDEPEPELPDERLDPEAFALAKKAREERAARKKEKKRAKAEAKRARQKARLAAMRQKQKPKKSRGTSSPRRDPEPPKKKKNQRGAQIEPKLPDAAEPPERGEQVAEVRPSTKSRAKTSAPPRRGPSTLASVKLLAIVLAILLALAAAVAAIVK